LTEVNGNKSRVQFPVTEVNGNKSRLRFSMTKVNVNDDAGGIECL